MVMLLPVRLGLAGKARLTEQGWKEAAGWGCWKKRRLAETAGRKKKSLKADGDE